MTTDRRQRFVTRPNGALWDEQVMRDYIGEIERRAVRPKVTRLSALDPMCVAAEAASRDTRPVWLRRRLAPKVMDHGGVA